MIASCGFFWNDCDVTLFSPFVLPSQTESQISQEGSHKERKKKKERKRAEQVKSVQHVKAKKEREREREIVHFLQKDLFFIRMIQRVYGFLKYVCKLHFFPSFVTAFVFHSFSRHNYARNGCSIF